MKKNLILISITLLLSMPHCKKDSNDLDLGGTFPVKVLDEICGTAVMQILDSNYYALGTNGYVQNGITYDHVFATDLSCSDMKELMTYAASLKGMELKVQLTQYRPDNTCVKCAATIPNAPANWLLINIIQ